jgi:hypothetical protein
MPPGGPRPWRDGRGWEERKAPRTEPAVVRGQGRHQIPGLLPEEAGGGAERRSRGDLGKLREGAWLPAAGLVVVVEEGAKGKWWEQAAAVGTRRVACGARPAEERRSGGVVGWRRSVSVT